MHSERVGEDQRRAGIWRGVMKRDRHHAAKDRPRRAPG
jgi:hypothetical protein